MKIDEVKFNTNEDVLYQIGMMLYQECNDEIASINENLGDRCSYQDLIDAELYEKKKEKELLQLAVKQLQNENIILKIEESQFNNYIK